jgi:hypothetical protein
MAVTQTPGSLADGQLPAAKATLYAVPASTKVYLPRIGMTLFNTSATTTETIAVYVKRSGSVSRQVAQFILAPKEFATVNVPQPLSAADEIEGSSTNATTVDYLICGVRES